MNRTAELVELAKQNQQVESNNALAKRLGVQRALVAHWVHGRSKPDISNFAKLSMAAGLSMEEALPYVADLEDCILCKVRNCYQDSRQTPAFFLPSKSPPAILGGFKLKKNYAEDLFGDVTVTQQDLVEYVQRFAPRVVQSGWRLENYIQSYDVASKVKRLKATGDWFK